MEKSLKFSLQVLEKSFIFHLKQKITSKFHIFANKKCEYRFSTCSRVGWSKMSMVGQRESDGIFVSGVKAKELMIIGSSLLLFLFQWENKNDFITIGSLIFSIQIKMSSQCHLLCSTLPYQMNHLNGFIDNEFF